MTTDDGCGSLHRFYQTAREGDLESLRSQWDAVEPAVSELDPETGRALDDALEADAPDTVRARTADLLFEDEMEPTLTGPGARILGTLLYWFGYLASFVLFAQAHSRTTIVRRLRWAYRTVGVDIQDTETVDGVERTVFRCPYRNLGAGRFGQRHACHDILDRVDDGYVTFLNRHRDIDYQRPRACRASECCYSEVAER